MNCPQLLNEPDRCGCWCKQVGNKAGQGSLTSGPSRWKGPRGKCVETH